MGRTKGRSKDFWLRSQEFQEFYDKNNRYPGIAGDDYEKSLYCWGNTRRKKFRDGVITESELESGTKGYPIVYEFVKNTGNDNNWYKKYEEYKNWTRAHLRVPAATRTNEQEAVLCDWMQFNIKQYRNGKLPQDRIDKINEISPLLLSNSSVREYKEELNNSIKDKAFNKEFYIGYYSDKSNELRVNNLVRNGIVTFSDMYYVMIDRLAKGDDKDKIYKDLVLDDDKLIRAFVNFIFNGNSTISDIIMYQSIFKLHIIDVLSVHNSYSFNIHDRLMYTMYNYITSSKHSEAKKRCFQVVIERYYDNNIHMTFEAVAQKHNIKRQRINQIVDRFFEYMNTQEISEILLTGRIKASEPLRITDAEVNNIDNYVFNNIDLSNRAFNCLNRTNIIYFRDLIKFFDDHNCLTQDDRYSALKSIRGLGESCADEIINLFNKGITSALRVRDIQFVEGFQTYETKVNRENFGKEIDYTEKAILSIVKNDDLENMIKHI